MQFKHSSCPGIMYVASTGACQTSCWALPDPTAGKGGCWHQAPACSGISPGGTAWLPQPPAFPAPSPVNAARRSCQGVLPGPAGLIDHPLFRWGGSTVSEEGRSLVPQWHEETCTLPYDAALKPETHRQCQLFGQTPLTARFHSCSVTGGAEALLGPALALLPAVRAHPQDQAAVPSHSPTLSCVITAPQLHCFSTGPSVGLNHQQRLIY